MKIIDAHTHINRPEEGSPNLYALLKKLGIDKVNTASLQCANPTQNTAVALGKVKHPGITYAFAGLDHVTGRDFLTQVKQYYAAGYDGMKMLEGKPTTRKALKLALDDPSLDPFYSFLEEKQFPMVMHVADPPAFWDREKIPGWAVEKGWFYDESFVPYSRYYDEIGNMLAKHPKLRAIFAHFFFLSDQSGRAQKFLDDHPSVFIDVTAGIEMYENFSKDPVFWRSFFIKNSGRIIYGTDATDNEIKNRDEGVALNGHGSMELEFLRTDHVFTHYGMTLRGIGLPDDAQEKILYSNFTGLVGEEPKKMDIGAVLKETAYLRDFIKDAADLRRLDEMVKQLKAVV
ncbi:MAG: amidohydrolase [Treponema sp.]|jgi:predicted TIM-barrel fold metal-dependent hydrolase|nr:amidohydrolase [Treponema sp.]